MPSKIIISFSHVTFIFLSDIIHHSFVFFFLIAITSSCSELSYFIPLFSHLLWIRPSLVPTTAQRVWRYLSEWTQLLPVNRSVLRYLLSLLLKTWLLIDPMVWRHHIRLVRLKIFYTYNSFSWLCINFKDSKRILVDVSYS